MPRDDELVRALNERVGRMDPETVVAIKVLSDFFDEVVDAADKASTAEDALRLHAQGETLARVIGCLTNDLRCQKLIRYHVEREAIALHALLIPSKN